MLEDLRRTQSTPSSDIERDVREGRLPLSLLFSGKRGSSRLTGALELAFYLTGEEANYPYLRSSRIVYLAERDLRLETEASLSLFRRQRNDRSRRFLIKTVRKTLLQYHVSIASLYENKKSGVKLRDEGGRGDTLFSNAEAIDAIILSLEDEKSFPQEKVDEICTELSARMKDDFFTLGKKSAGATIDEIRAVQDWLDEGIEEKCLILENPEDLTEGAKNSMLKLLEEPPEHSHIILLSARPDRLLPTILSRVRKYHFPELPEKVISTLIGEDLAIYGSYTSFDSFFFAEGSDEESRRAMEEAVSLYSEALLAGRMLTLEDETRIFSAIEKMHSYPYFRERISEVLEDALRKGGNLKCVKKAWRSLNEAMFRADTYNMNIRLAFDAALREACCGE